MVRIAEELAARVIRALSTLLRKPLSLVDGEVRADLPLLDEERAVVHDLSDLVRASNAGEEQVRELEARVAQLQHENIELMM